MRITGRTGDVLSIESSAEGCGDALPELNSFRLSFHVRMSEVQAIDCARSEASGRLGLVVEVAHGGIDVRHRDLHEPAHLGIVDEEASVHDYARYDYSGLEALAAELKSANPRETDALLVFDEEVPVQVLVSVADALAGPDCSRDTSAIWSSGGVPAECNFWRITMEVLR
jgi:hypothetical protein